MSDKNGKNVKIHTIYKNENGKEIPGVTAPLSILAKPALIPWAHKLGIRGIDWRTYRDDKAEIGTLVHMIILSHIKNQPFDKSGYTERQIDLAENSFIKYLDWEKIHKMEPVLLETPLVSEIYQYGGTPDNYCLLDGIYTYIDYKTGKAIYDEMFYQAAAYKQLLEENNYYVKGVKILRIGRDENEGFEEQDLYDLSKHFELFLACLKIYNLQKKIKREE